MNILYLEYHAVFAEEIAKQFLAAHRVTVVPSLLAARSALASESYDLILSDYDLDDGKGDEFVRECRAAHPDLPIIAVSSHEAGNTALLKAGASAVCGKMEFDQIHQTIGRLTRLGGSLMHTEHSAKSNQKDGQVFSRIVGRQLSAVVFVQDYLQLQFDGPTLTILTRIAVRSGSEGVVVEGAAGWRDALCGQITRIVKAVHLDSHELVVDFADGSAISASIRPEDYRCAEAIQFRDGIVIAVI